MKVLLNIKGKKSQFTMGLVTCALIHCNWLSIEGFLHLNMAYVWGGGIGNVLCKNYRDYMEPYICYTGAVLECSAVMLSSSLKLHERSYIRVLILAAWLCSLEGTLDMRSRSWWAHY